MYAFLMPKAFLSVACIQKKAVWFHIYEHVHNLYVTVHLTIE